MDVTSYAVFQSSPWRVAVCWNVSVAWSKRAPSHHPSIALPNVRTSSRCVLPTTSAAGSGCAAIAPHDPGSHLYR